MPTAGWRADLVNNGNLPEREESVFAYEVNDGTGRKYSHFGTIGKSNFYTVNNMYRNPGRGISTSWDTPIIFCTTFSIDKMNISWKFEGHRCNIKKNMKINFDFDIDF